MSVQDWMTRKAERAADPMFSPKLSTPEAKELADVTHKQHFGEFAARVGGVVVAKSRSTKEANNRFYFPIEDCVQRHFAPSAKRWR
mmetsp:Transcript_23529/g.46354  ORF Transcript_23529/g.46354 Transcript_23529/m.46354 type:complete len:86 (-) Transcript_23529:431-688(-)